MRMTIKSRIALIVAVAMLALVIVTASSELYERNVSSQIDSIRDGYLPKIRLRPQLQGGFDKLVRSFQDAAQASDGDELAATGARRDELQRLAQDAGDALTVGQITALRLAIDDYYTAGAAVTKKLIAGDAGESLRALVEDLEAKRARTAALIDQTTLFDEAALSRSFEDARAAQRAGRTVRLAVGGACLIALLGLSLWIAAALVRSLGCLADGLERFSRNDFSTPIAVPGGDELADLATTANEMADGLRQLDGERERAAWLRAGISGLHEALSGDLPPGVVADTAVAYLARYLEVPIAALYLGPAAGPFELCGRFGLPAGAAAVFSLGEGPVGEAARRTEIVAVPAPAGMRVRTGIVEAAPTSLVLVPLARDGAVTGVLELAPVRPWRGEDAELVRLARDTIALKLEMAASRTATQELLAQTQRQAKELERAAAELEAKAAELTRASAYKSQFLASMSHELRTPLNAIIGFSEILFDGGVPLDDDMAREYIGDILTSGRHLLQLINDVLDLAKVEAGRLELHPAKLSLTKVVSEVLSVLRSSAAKQGVRIASDVDPAVDELVLDAARLKQVLYNYLSNALKFTPAQGTVTLRARAEGAGEVRIEVIDTGIGIAADEIPKLFSEFKQTADGARKADSTGLGLALTKKIVEAQGGRVGVASVRGEGSTFHAVLPRVHTVAAAPVAVEAVPAGGSGPAILIVEDDAEDRRQLVAALARAGYAVEAVGTGADAVARCGTRKYDAITLDLLLPDMTGLEVLDQLRSGPNSDVPVVVVTVVAERGAVAGFAVHDVLPKPLSEPQLLASLVRAGVRPDERSSTVLVVDDDAASLKVMAATLAQLGYRATCEQDPISALASAKASAPAAIVLDLLMPAMTGFEFLAHLRAAPSGVGVPVIVWTSKDLTTDELAQLRRSASGVVAKGDGNARVLAELATHLPTRAPGAS